MSYETIVYTKKEGIAEIVLNRPDVLNALSIQLHGDCLAALEDAGTDENVRVVTITGAGRAFSAGDDVREFTTLRSMPPDEMTIYLRRNGCYGLFEAIRSLRKPVIAAVNGHALGAGCELALACDIVIASETARFGVPFVRLGVVGGTALLGRIIGYHKACQLLFTGDTIDAREAEAMGMVNQVVAPEQLQSSVMELAHRLAKGATKAIGLMKWALNLGISSDLDNGLNHQVQAVMLAFQTEDVGEGAQAFLEKREPLFKGK